MYDQLTDSMVKLLKEENPQLNEMDLIQTIKTIKLISTTKRTLFEKNGAIEDWVPTPACLKELVNTVVSSINIEYAIQTFIDLAKERKFPITTTLDAKFLVHVKYLISSGKIQPLIKPDP